MLEIPLPHKIQFITSKKPHGAQIIIEPCYPGYGTTLGNALRRVLLSSLAGSAITAIKIKGVQHEFSTIPYVKEDMIEIILNLKLLRLKVFSEGIVKLLLKVNGEKEVLAKDIMPSTEVEIANPNLPIATLTNKAAELEMEIFVSQGRGYVPTEARDKENLEVGAIAVDSIFTPVQNVGFKVENVRVGQMTNYDRLLLDIETDGIVTPEEALKEAAKILINHFNFVANFDQETKKIEEKTDEKIKKESLITEKNSEEGEKEEITEKKEVEEPKKKRGRPRKKKD